MYQELLALLIMVNVVAFLLMGYDKGISVRGGNVSRIPERTLFLFALVFGAAGIYLGMLGFRHKTRKWYFQIGIPLLILLNLAAIYALQQFLAAN